MDRQPGAWHPEARIIDRHTAMAPVHRQRKWQLEYPARLIDPPTILRLDETPCLVVGL